MSVCLDKKRKCYYISYQLKMPDGSFKTFNIRNSEWTMARGKKFVKSIEQEEIEQDKKKRKIHIHAGNNISLEDFFEIYKSEVSAHFADATAYSKIKAIKKYLIDVFSCDKDIDLILTVNNIEKFKQNVLQSDLCGKRKNVIFGFLREFIAIASDREYISYELEKKCCKLLKPISIEHEVEEKIKYWTNEEWETFYQTFQKEDKWRIYFLTSYMAALRIGECIALQWKDFDPVKGTLYIRQSVTIGRKIKRTKNRSSTALVSIPKKLIDELIEFKKAMCASDEDFIFFANKMTAPTTVRRIMNQHIENAGVTKIGPHGLRHSCASRMINMGISPLIVSKHLRHSSIKETLDTYSHIFPSETVGVIDKVFR